MRKNGNGLLGKILVNLRNKSFKKGDQIRSPFLEDSFLRITKILISVSFNNLAHSPTVECMMLMEMGI